MTPDDLPDFELPEGNPPVFPDRKATPEEIDAWHMENHRLRIARGDFARSFTPVDVPFEMP